MAQQISVRVPATCATLSCAFACAALALGLYLHINIRPRPDRTVNVRYSGVTPERVPTDPTNLIARTIRNTLEGWHKARGFDLEIENQIPVGVGLGSSAAAIVGALAACHWMADTALSDEELVSMATRLEGHPDNAAAAWHGGFTVAVEHRGAVLAYSCPVPDSLQLVLVVAAYAVPTEKARPALGWPSSSAHGGGTSHRSAVPSRQLFSGTAELL